MLRIGDRETVMSVLKSIINFFNLEGGTRPHIVNIARPKMLFNYGTFFLFRKFNPLKVPYKPINLMVEVSTKCNLVCPACERELFKEELGGLPKENVKLENIRKLSTILPYVYSVYLVSGIGEPFLNPEFWEIHKFFKNFGLKTGYFTNTTFLTEDLVRRTFEEKVNTVTVSIDTYDKDKYSKIKLGADYNKAVDIIRLFSTYKRQYNVKYFSLGTNFIFRKDNYRDILRYLDFAKELGVDYLHCSSLITHLERDKNLSFFLVRQEEKENIFKKALEKAKRLGIGIRLPNLTVDGKDTCGYLWRCLCVFYNGDICACPYFRTDRYFYYHDDKGKMFYRKMWVKNTIVGNYLEEDINKIWNGPTIKKLRRTVLGRITTSPCSNCYYKYDFH